MILVKPSFKFLTKIDNFNHYSVLEDENISVKIICNRGVTHEIVRHRLVTYSSGYNYKGEVTFVIPPWIETGPGEYNSAYEPSLTPWKQSTWLWFRSMLNAERSYKELMLCGWSPQRACSVLPNSLKTETVMTANICEWRHILSTSATHPQIQEVMIPILAEFKRLLPIGIFYYHFFPHTIQ